MQLLYSSYWSAAQSLCFLQSSCQWGALRRTRMRSQTSIALLIQLSLVHQKLRIVSLTNVYLLPANSGSAARHALSNVSQGSLVPCSSSFVLGRWRRVLGARKWRFSWRAREGSLRHPTQGLICHRHHHQNLADGRSPEVREGNQETQTGDGLTKIKNSFFRDHL